MTEQELIAGHGLTAEQFDELAGELAQIDPTLSAERALELIKWQVSIAGAPEAGPGMAAAHEWSERQLELLERAARGHL